MTEAEWKVLGEYIRTVADLLCLREWVFTLSHEPPEESINAATCTRPEGRRHATIRVHRGFRQDSPDDQRNTIVHELLHCHLGPMNDILRIAVLPELSQSAYDVLSVAYRQQMEYATDLLASVCEDLAPMIEWPCAERSDHDG